MTVLVPRRNPLIRAAEPESETPVWYEFSQPTEILQADDQAQVTEVIARAERAAATGSFAVGFVTYEAASAFDSALVTRPASDLPLAWFGIFGQRCQRPEPPSAAPLPALAHWSPSLGLSAYTLLVERCRSAIAAGDTYQVNLTFRLTAPFEEDPLALFVRLFEAQSVPHAAFLDLGAHVICSASPELFFSIDGSRVRCRPMKGTAARGPTVAADDRQALALYDSQKNRAENLMIVDMVRNDLGRIARTGSVRVTELYALETYESIHQLTSTIEAETDASVAEIFSALFPSASITGAPKVRTMQLLAELESSPRGIYTGAIGYLGPDRRGAFNVAIRTVSVDRKRSRATYGTGGGIVWDSDPESEYRECATKALILTRETPRFALFETIRWEPETGFFLLERHLARLASSARYFAFPCDPERCREVLLEAASGLGHGPQRLRLTLQRDGRVLVESGPLDAARQPWALALASQPVAAGERLLYHKTTERSIYERARREAPGYDDVLLYNQQGRLTESTVANLAVRLDGRLLTPPIDDGLLPGTLREELLASGRLETASLTIADLRRAADVRLYNSLRGWIEIGRIDELTERGAETVWRNSGPQAS